MQEEVMQFVNTWYSGHVQGVGFRYQTLQVAKEFEICGIVQNLSDGRVFLEMTGKREEIEAFLSELEQQMAPYIREIECKWNKIAIRDKKYDGFKIVYADFTSNKNE